MVKIHPESNTTALPPFLRGLALPPPPPQPRATRPRKDCCCFFCKLCFWMYVSLFLAFLIFWLILLPQELKITINDASLTRFELSKNDNDNDNTTLFYNLALNITIRNPNKKVGVYFHRVQAIANYGKATFAVTTSDATPFYQGHKNTTVVPMSIEGQQLMSFAEVDQYEFETSCGVYSIDLKLALRVGAKYVKMKSRHYNPPKIDCQLKVPLRRSNTTINIESFEATMCDNVYILTNPDE